METDGLTIPPAVLADADLRPAAKLALARMLDLARGGGLVFISRSDLGRDLGMTNRAVKTALRELVKRRLVVCECTHSGRGRPRGYRNLGAAARLAGLRAIPAGEETNLYPPKVRQPTLFDLADSDTGKGEEGRAPHRTPAR